MLSHYGLVKEFWVEAASTACYLINRSPNGALDGCIPEELWSCNLVDYSNLRIFGCPVYSHVNEGKLEPRVKKCLFLGYGLGVKGHRFYDPDSYKTFHSHNVTFNENVMLSSRKDVVVSSNYDQEKVEFEVEVPIRKEDVPKSSTTQEDQITIVDDITRHMSQQRQRSPLRRGLPHPWSMAQDLPQQ